MALKWNSESGSYELAFEEPSLKGENPYVSSEEMAGPKLTTKTATPPTPTSAGANSTQESADMLKLLAKLGAGGANPWVAGAGLGLQAIGMIQQGKQREREMEYQNKLAQYNARQRQLENLAEIGRSLKA